ncbi:RagB/SusD family nutrient uptake outer membrane protein [Chitinophaga sp. GCM10012297]|uniref:RagB/SusD family nutrient uptake outer membrane protein n=1 Tax=Chitinophaga chungangae TaxID=2821488 RepID=A0ABS3YFB8_9BACT|nr:RagB/SusD family nutrient uptake outer membrane protein [Chitinophaga chungangae]MBO9153349.1 RagB/SusD family nutrient uptake outer membrane protein [Chitinophaga chungangae]
MRTTSYFIILFISVFSAGCLKDIEPSDALTTGTLTGTKEGLQQGLNGAYALFKDHVSFNGTVDGNNMYLRQYFQMSDFAGDDIVCAQTTTDPLFYSFSLDHTATQTNSRYFWYISYKIINDVNTVLESAEKIENPDESIQQLIGECYFLRALCHFNLVRFYGKPYSHDPSAAGVILRTSTEDPSLKARANVGEVYDAVIADAIKGAELMNQPRGVQYGSKEAAWALLSRVYLYKEDNDNAISYADKVIGSNRFTLETAATFPSLFANAMAGKETIFCVAFTTADDYGKAGSIASMLYSDGNSGWGEEYASQSLRDTMSEHPEDVRWSYIKPLKVGNVVQTKNGIEVYYISKFSFQGGSPTLSSPILLRFAEVYLNKAEALAKKGDVPGALDNVDMIRKNRGLENSLYNRVLPAGKTALQTVLKERRIELAFEGHRNFDVYRNKLDMNRTYWGYHLPGLKESDIDLSAQPRNYPNLINKWDATRIIYYVPIDEIQTNQLCIQNP